MARQLEDTLDDLDTRPHKKQRKQRARLSCTECRRLKMKCDRQEPCSNCVRRSRASICRIDQVEQSSLSEVDHDGTTTLHDITLPAVNDDTTAELLQPDLRMEQSQPLLSQIVSSTPLVESDMALSNGTLTLYAKGRYRYLGPTAGSEWLKDSETRELDSAPGTRAPSPQRNHSLLDRFTVAFPFGGVFATGKIGMQDMLMQLPPREEAQILVEAYYKYCAWHHDVAPRSDFSTLFNEVYTAKESMSHVDPQDLALVYIIIAQGTMFNIEMPDQDPSGEDWLRLAELALVKGEFLSNNTLSGIQCLHLMAHMHLQLDKGRQGDKAWPLWGLVMRLVQAMGLHRDGARWNLPPHVVQQRRKVFWELQAAETFQAHCFSRPSALNPEHYDTAFPDDPSPADEKSYSTLRFELSQLSAEILNLTVKVRKPAYSEVAVLNARLSEFERSIPYKLRCRAALLAMPSRYSDLTTAIEASPEPSRRSMSNAFQQTNLALNVTETFINLNRPYFAKAVYDDKGIRVDSEYGPSFLTVIERCAIIIAITKDIHERFPAVSTRQWNLWHHVFNTALCLGTLVLRDSSSSVASFAVAQIETATELFTSLLQHGAKSPRYQRNLQWLLKLRSRLAAKLQALPAEPADDSDGENPENMELLGWRTRLIEQVDQDHRRGRPIRTARSFTDASGPPTDPLPHAVSFMTPESTDELLHAFWDPMLLQDIFPDPTNHNLIDTVPAWWAAT